MSVNNTLTAIALGFGVLSTGSILSLLYKAMYTGNQNGITCIDCNSYGEGNFEIVMFIIGFIIILYMFMLSLERMV